MSVDNTGRDINRKEQKQQAKRGILQKFIVTFWEAIDETRHLLYQGHAKLGTTECFQGDISLTITSCHGELMNSRIWNKLVYRPGKIKALFQSLRVDRKRKFLQQEARVIDYQYQ